MAGIEETSLPRRNFLKVGGALGVVAATGVLSTALAGCTSDTGPVEGGPFTFVVVSGARITESNENTGVYKYKKRCKVCGWESLLNTTMNGIGVDSEYVCPQCGYRNKLVIHVFQGVEEDEPVTETLRSLMHAVEGEFQANANYIAFADTAQQEGHAEIAAITRAVADAELKHGTDEFEIAQKLGSVTRPTPNAVITYGTRDNLQKAIDNETYEYSIMYPELIAASVEEDVTEALTIFNYAHQAEMVHARLFTDLLNSIDDFDKVKYAKVYRCPVCGNIEVTTRPEHCHICNVAGSYYEEYIIVR